jgi:phage baseplate assembly protein W
MSTAVKTPIGLTFPISHGPMGYFNQSFDVVDQVKSNLYLLLNTKKGERRFNLDFGSSLYNVLFNFNNEELQTILESSIKKDVRKWLPYVDIKSVTISDSDEEKDGYHVKISVVFTADNVGITSPQNITLVAAQGNI